MFSLRLFLFGTPRVERDGQILPIRRRKTLALLAYLATTGQPHTRDALATLLWPENDPSSALANLRRDLSRLKRALGDHILIIDRLRVGVNLHVDPAHSAELRDAGAAPVAGHPEPAEGHPEPAEGLWLDVAAFQARVTQVQAHSEGTRGLCPDSPGLGPDSPGLGPDSPGLCPDCLAALTEAVALYSDDFMAGFSLPDSLEFDEWQLFQAEGLRQSMAEGLGRLIGWYTHQGEYKQGIPYARRWVALDPLHEPAQRELMRLYAWSGQWAVALRQYQACARLLEQELGVSPEPETAALYEAIRTQRLPLPVAEETSRLPPKLAGAGATHERYLQENLLAVGGHGEVYQGRDRATGQPVVIKRLKPEMITQDPTLVQRFVREAEVLCQLNHPNIVKMLATFEQNGQHHIVMEHAPGGSLRELLNTEPRLPLERVLDIALELADALSRAHHLDIIHRDLKPENVLLAADGTPRLTDFGMARLQRDDVHLTQAGMIIGSPAYLSPEAVRGEELDARSDIWSFGVLLYEMLAGRLPYEGDSITSLLADILTQPVPEIQQSRPALPPPLIGLLERMLVKEREGRITSVRQVAAEVEAIRAGRMDDGRPVQEPRETTVPVPVYNLPADSTPFFGREAELVQIDELLADPACRLLTIMGLGGMGKSRLALEAARLAIEAPGLQFQHGVGFVPLAGVETVNALPAAVANAINVSLTGSGDPTTQLLNALRQKEMLLVLDNFEHLLADDASLDGASLLVQLLSTCPAVKLLVTSRAPVQIEAEWRLNLEGLSYPRDETEAKGDFGAIQLFVQTASQVRPDLQLNHANASLVRRVCQLAGGMPLAVKLAATWLRVLPIERVVAEMERNLDILTTRMRGVPSRQRSMHAVFDYTWELLTGPEQQVFPAFSVFRGGFTKEAAAQVTRATPFHMSGLVDHGLLQMQRTSDGLRYHVHELTRQYAAEKLVGALRDRVYARLCQYYATFLQQRYQPIQQAEFKTALQEIATELDNVHAAWQWLLTAIRNQQTTDLGLMEQVTLTLHLYYYLKGPLQTGRQTFAQAAEAMQAAGWGTSDDADPSSTQRRNALARVQLREAFFSLGLGDYETVDRILAQVLPWFRESGDLGETALALSTWGKTNLLRGERPLAQEQLQESLSLFQKVGNSFGCADVLKVLGVVAVDRGHYEQALRFYRESLDSFQQLGFAPGMSQLLHNIGTALFRQQDYENALASYQRALDIAKAADFARMIMESTGAVGGVYRALGQYQRSETNLKQSVAMAKEMGEQRLVAANLNNLGQTYLAMNDLVASERTLREGLTVGWKTENIPNALACISTLARVRAQQGRVEDALRALLFVEAHKAAMAIDKTRNQRLLSELIEELRPSVVDAARAWAQSKTLGEVVEWLSS